MRPARLLQLLLAAVLLLTLGAGAAVPGPPYPWPAYTVLPVLFVPTDWDAAGAEVQAEAAALRVAMGEIQQFYGDALAGRTLRLDLLQVLQASGPKEDYHILWNGGNIYEDGVEFTGNMEAAVVAELHARGIPTPPAQDEDGYSVLIFVKGAGGYAGGRELGAGDGGWAILGDWCIDSIQGQVPEGQYWWSGRRKQVGAAAHELGHTFGLPHPDAYGGDWSTTIMGNWWDYPNLGFNAWEIDELRANKAAFFSRLVLEAPALQAGAVALIAVRGGAANQLAWPVYSRAGTGLQAVPQLDLTLGLHAPALLAAPMRANAQGAAQWTVSIPARAAGLEVWLQAMQRGETSGIARRTIQ